MIIKINKVPNGPAPLEVRQQWKDLEMPAERLSTAALEVDPIKTTAMGVKSNFFSDAKQAHGFLEKHLPGASIGNRGGFVVSYNDAISALRSKSSQAADWFVGHWPKSHPFCFSPNDAEIVQQ